MIFKFLLIPFLLIALSEPIQASTTLETKAAETTLEVSTERVSTEVQRVFFRELRRYPLNNRAVPEEISSLNGKRVSIVGFMVPFDRIENITQFILLQAPFMGCLHVPPPQANEVLMVNTNTPLRTFTYDPIRIIGDLVIEEVFIEGFLVSVYTINNASVSSSTAQDAELDDLPPNFHFYGDL